MDADGLPIVGPNIDFTKVGPINHKRTLAFVNHFITHTVRFLNRFSCVCEEKLSDLSNRIQRVEIAMSILEAKLASIPGLEDVTVSTPAPSQQTPAPAAATTIPQAPPPPEAPGPPPPPAAEPEPEPEKPTMTVSKDPRYAPYFLKLKVGVPAIALRPKMLAENLDPDLLETPDAPAPPGAPEAKDDSDSEMSSASSFSDDD